MEINDPKTSVAFNGWGLDPYGELFIPADEDAPLAFARRTLNGRVAFENDRANLLYEKFMSKRGIDPATIERAWEVSRYRDFHPRSVYERPYDPNWAKLCTTKNYIEPITEDTPANDIRRKNVSEKTLSIIATRRNADWSAYSWGPPTGYRGKADDDFYKDHAFPMNNTDLRRIIENTLKEKIDKGTGEPTRENGQRFS
jgi:hypothetical protein